MAAVVTKCVIAVVLLLQTATSEGASTGTGSVVRHQSVIARAALLARAQKKGQGEPNLLKRGSQLALLQTKLPGVANEATRTLQSLDTNGNGKIDPAEIAGFARSQGLDPGSATTELSALDANGDGALDATELAGVLGTDASAGDASAQRAPVQVASLAKPVELAKTVMVQAPVLRPSQPQIQLAQPAPVLAAPEPAISSIDSSVAMTSITAGASAARTAQSIDGSSAQSAANTIVQQLALETQEETKAQRLEHRAAELRANSTALTRQMVQNALAAGSEAASKKAKEVLSQLLQLESEETKNEVAVAALRAKAKAELREAQELMSIADVALKQAWPHGQNGVGNNPAV